MCYIYHHYYLSLVIWKACPGQRWWKLSATRFNLSPIIGSPTEIAPFEKTAGACSLGEGTFSHWSDSARGSTASIWTQILHGGRGYQGEYVFGTGSRAGAYLPNKSGWGIPRHCIIKPILWIAGVSPVALENAMGFLRLWETPSDVVLGCCTLHS